MQNRPRLLQVGRLLPWLEARLATDYDTHRLADEADEADPRDFLAARGAEFVGLVTSAGGSGADAALIDALPKLRVISSFGVGLDRIDLVAAARRGIAVGYTPDVLNDCVADLAMALLLDIARRTPEADRYVRAGSWGAPSSTAFPLGRKVSGARLGLVGFGRIGRTIARRACGFDMAIRYHARRAVADTRHPHEPSLAALADWADFLVVITAGGVATRHLIDAAVLDALGPEGFLINVARGSVVDEVALVGALAERRIAGAALDVFEHEPQVPAELLALDNVVLLPHIASGTRETRQAMAQRVIDNLHAHFAGKPMPSAAPLP